MNWQENYTIETLVTPKGFSYDGAFGGIKASSTKLDTGWIVSETKANYAVVCTTNKMAAAPILLTKEIAKENEFIRAVVVNSGNANACTGEQGMKDAKEMQNTVAKKLNLSEKDVIVASTGVIGQLMPMEKVNAGINGLRRETNIDAFSKAILTTDLIEKGCSITFTVGKETITITGVAKGSGMIHPNMATMLGFITTDAKIDNATLQSILRESVEESFHSISVDGDTSTNDMVIVLANGNAQTEPITATEEGLQLFKNACKAVCIHLAKQIARDGEGATKLVQVNVTEAKSKEEARKAAKQIITSSLVKTALFGCDGNWGRIASAIGQSQVDFEYSKLTIKICEIVVLENGVPSIVDEDVLTNRLSENEVVIEASLGFGEYSGTAYGCDLSYDYVKINGEYRS